MLYPQAFMDGLRARLPVSEVVGHYLPVKRHGREYQALCPFHKEKTPSFTVNDEKGFYHCFGCGAHGDAIGFVKEIEGISYREAIEKLAAKAGMEVPAPTAQEARREHTRRSLQEVAEAACRWFEARLQSAAGEPARRYLADRGVSQAMCEHFRLGFAPDDRQALARAMRDEGIGEQQLVEAGLLITSADKSPYARFRNRLIFPIRDRRSQVVGFGGRLLPTNQPTSAPKYLNSPDSELFHKGHLLYHYDRARPVVREAGTLLVCEGYMDVIALYQAGLTYAVAPLGTAITAAQLELCWQAADEPVICLDGDAAGQRAMWRAIELALPLLKPGKSLKFVRLPAGEDPDSLVKTQGKTAMEALIAQAGALPERIWEHVTAAGGSGPDARAAQEHHLMQLADQIAHPTVRAHYRAHFKQLLWEQSRPVKGNAAGMRRVGSVQMPQAVELPHLPADLAAQQQRVAAQCLALVILYPQLLAEGEAEEFIACLPLSSGGPETLRQAMLGEWSRDEALTRETLQRRLEEAGCEQALAGLYQAAQAVAPPELLADESATQLVLAKRVWEQTRHHYHLMTLQQELQAAQRQFAAEMTPENLQQVMALKNQLAEAEVRRDRLYHALLLEQEAG